MNPTPKQIQERAEKDGISIEAARLRIIDPLYSRLPRSLRRDKKSFIPRAPKRFTNLRRAARIWNP